ncbi:rhotekin 2, partial [Trichuris trichiura]
NSEQPELQQNEESAKQANTATAIPSDSEVRKGQIVLGEASSDVVVASLEPVDPRNNPPPFKPAEMSVKSPDIQIDERLYIEKSKGFYKADRRQVEKILSPESEVTAPSMDAKERIEQIDCAGAVQTTFSHVAYSLHGILAGFSVFHCFFIFSNVHESAINAQFMPFYSPLAMIIHSLYFGVGAVCTIAAMDRYDLYQSVELLFLGSLSCWRLFFHFGMVCLFLLMLAVSLATLSIDEQISSLWYNSTSIFVNEYSPQKVNQTLFVHDVLVWKYYILTRSLLLCFTWLLAQFGPDMLTAVLKARMQRTLAQPKKSLPMQVVAFGCSQSPSSTVRVCGGRVVSVSMKKFCTELFKDMLVDAVGVLAFDDI